MHMIGGDNKVQYAYRCIASVETGPKAVFDRGDFPDRGYVESQTRRKSNEQAPEVQRRGEVPHHRGSPAAGRQHGGGVPPAWHTASVFYRWEAQMREGAKEGLADKRGRKEKAAAAEIERLQAELARKNDVIAELTEALIEGKRGSRTICGHSDPGSGEGGDRELRARGQRARRTPTAAGLSRSGPWLEPLSALVLAGGGRRGSGRRPRWRPPVGPSVARGTRSGYQVLAGASKGRLPAAGLADGTSW